MRAHSSDTQAPRGGRLMYLLGLAALGLGLSLLMPFMDTALRPVGAVALLLGTVLLGSYFLARLKAEMSAESHSLEPTWRKPAHGAAGYGSLPASDGPEKPAPKPPPLPVPAAALATADTGWTPALFDRLSAHQFDAVCAALFAQGGFETRCQSHGAQGGVTIWLYSRHGQQGKDSPVAVALCQQWQGQPVGVRELHALQALMASRQLQRGTCATSSTYTDNARKFASYNGINALDRGGLLALIKKRTPAQQQALLALALDGTA